MRRGTSQRIPIILVCLGVAAPAFPTRDKSISGVTVITRHSIPHGRAMPVIALSTTAGTRARAHKYGAQNRPSSNAGTRGMWNDPHDTMTRNESRGAHQIPWYHSVRLTAAAIPT